MGGLGGLFGLAVAMVFFRGWGMAGAAAGMHLALQLNAAPAGPRAGEAWGHAAPAATAANYLALVLGRRRKRRLPPDHPPGG